MEIVIASDLRESGVEEGISIMENLIKKIQKDLAEGEFGCWGC